MMMVAASMEPCLTVKSPIDGCLLHSTIAIALHLYVQNVEAMILLVVGDDWHIHILVGLKFLVGGSSRLLAPRKHALKCFQAAGHTSYGSR